MLSLWRPGYASALDLVDHDLSCYHIDDEYTFSPVEQPTGTEEAALISRVDQVFIHSPALMAKKGNLNPHTTFVPNGVDFAAYSASHPEPDEFRAIPHPRVGYVGIIKPQLDFELIRALAERHPKWSFVLVGPIQHNDIVGPFLETLSRMPNVYLLGGKPLDRLPAYNQHLDACMLCYRVDGCTKFIYPLKLHESLATGRPVVGPPLPSLRSFNDVVTIARTPEEWSRVLEVSLAHTPPSHIEARRAVARRHDWNALADRVVGRLCEQLGSDYLERFERAAPRPTATVSAAAFAVR